MATVTHRRFASDDEGFDSDLFDTRFYPRKVYRDGRGPHVPLMLTDGMPPRRALIDANAHRPHFADLSDARLQDGLRQAAEARDAWIRGLRTHG